MKAVTFEEIKEAEDDEPCTVSEVTEESVREGEAKVEADTVKD